MHIDVLPRLTDEEREALDGGYIAMEGVPAAGPIRKPRVTRLAKLIIAISVLALTGCAMTSTQKKWTGIAAGVLIVGAIAAHEVDSGKSDADLAVTAPSLPCHPQPNGTCR